MIDLPVAAAPAPPMTRSELWRARLDSLLVDHGFIRYVRYNLHRVSDRVWRAAQPSPAQLRRAKAAGIRTIVNLRGRRDTCGSYVLERQACERLDLALVDFPIRSRAPLDRPTLHAAGDMFARIDYPALFHCKSGSDRVAFMTTLYLFLAEGEALRRAMKQLSFRYGHIKSGKTGIIDHFFERFLAETDGSQAAFYPWVDERYDPTTLAADFRPTLVGDFLVNRVLKRE